MRRELTLGRFFGLTMVGIMSGAATPVLADTQPDLVQAPVEKIFVPAGYDDNDNVEVVLHGHFPNSCYKVGPAEAIVDPENRTIEVRAKAYFYKDGTCTDMLVPFTETLSIGLLKSGNYQIVADTPMEGPAATLTVANATSSNPDDYLYAPVETLKLSPEAKGVYDLTIEGRYPHMFIGCMVVKDVRLNVTSGKVLVVQPIAELTDGPICEAQTRSKKFVISKKVPFGLEQTEYLLHSRATSGRSVNRLINIATDL